MSKDIDQLRVIMRVTGTPSEELLRQITNCEVRYCCPLCKHVFTVFYFFCKSGHISPINRLNSWLICLTVI